MNYAPKKVGIEDNDMLRQKEIEIDAMKNPTLLAKPKLK